MVNLDAVCKTAERLEERGFLAYAVALRDMEQRLRREHLTSLEVSMVTVALEHRCRPLPASLLCRRVREFLGSDAAPAWQVRRLLRPPLFTLTDAGWQWCGRWMVWHESHRQLHQQCGRLLEEARRLEIER